MSMSLREQLLAAGLGNKKQARQAEQQQKQQQHHQAKNKAAREEQDQRAAEARAKAQAAKAARDAELNRKRQENAERKEKWAQIKQLIEQHRLPKPADSEEYFNFIDRGKVRRITADNALRERLVAGTVVIARCEGRYDIVLAEIGDRIRERDERAVVKLNAEEAKPSDDDPYKEYVVPDDLMW
jgi:uncharacterized protein YaiL (DUF2058 family)